MHDMRFNSSQTAGAQNQQSLSSDKPKGRAFSNFLKSLFKVVVVLVLLYGAIMASRYFISRSSDFVNAPYSAVFLVNGQVYFGKIADNGKGEIVMKEVYYLQAGADGFSPNQNLGANQFTMVKLGQELHGPTDELFINKAQIVFYENLRDDSRVVESIRQHAANSR